MLEITALVISEELRTGKKKPFWQMDLKTESGNVRAVIWDVENPEKDGLPRKGELVRLTEYKDQLDSKYNNLIIPINGFKVIARNEIDKNLNDKLFNCKKATVEQLKAAYHIITDKSLYADESHFKFVMACLASVPKEQLLVCPAATSIHHNWSGGLLVHTSQVLQIAKGIVQSFPTPHLITPSVVYAAATLHDLGKVNTYGIDEIGQAYSTTDENTLGHIYYSLSIVDAVANTKTVDKQFLNEVKHAIASHHNLPEYGAIKRPSSLESIIVSQCDYLGSRLGIVESKIESNKENKQPLEKDWRSYGDYYFATMALRKYCAI